MADAQAHDFGVIYSPSNVVSTGPLVGLSPAELKSTGIRFVRIQWLDLTNKLRCRIVPISYYEKLLGSKRPGVSMVKCAFALIDVTPAPGFDGTGQHLYVIDTQSIKLCVYAEGHASVMGWLQEYSPVMRPNGHTSIDVQYCPRYVLRKVIDEAKKMGVDLLVGNEVEFTLLSSTNPVIPVNNQGWSLTSATYSGNPAAIVMNEIAEAIETSGIELQMYHSEGGMGQYEVVSGPLPPLEAADALVHMREIIYNVANKYNLRATMSPKTFLNAIGSGAHIHISVHKPDPNPSAHPNLHMHESQFLAGLLSSLRGLSALTLPTPASYLRIADGAWSGGTHVCWGIDEREAPIRLCNHSVPANRNFEIRNVDGTSNPYLAIAGVIAAGLKGLQVGKEAAGEVKDGKVAANMKSEARRKAGITERLPKKPEEAREALQYDALMGVYLGPEFVDKYLSANKIKALEKSLGDCESEKGHIKLVESY